MGMMNQQNHVEAAGGPALEIVVDPRAAELYELYQLYLSRYVRECRGNNEYRMIAARKAMQLRHESYLLWYWYGINEPAALALFKARTLETADLIEPVAEGGTQQCY